MAWVCIAHFERLVGLNHGLRDGDVVGIIVARGCEVVGPADFRLTFHVERNSRNAQFHFGICARWVNRNAIDKRAPRCGYAHANRVFALFLCVKFKERGVNIEVIARLTLSHLVGHVESKLSIYSTSVVRKQFAFEVDGLLWHCIFAASDRQFAHIEVYVGSFFKLQSNQRQFLAVEIVAHNKAFAYPLVGIGQFVLCSQGVGMLGCFATFGGEYQVQLGSTGLHLIFQRDNVALLQVETCFKELQILLIY